MAENYTASNRRIAKNTIALYIRMVVMLVITLYTSRVVLDVLGETDYGVYNVVGGVIVLFSFINTALSSSTQRYLNYALGADSVNTPFATFKYADAVKQPMNSRLDSILSQVGLTDRFLSFDDEGRICETLSRPIDWDAVNRQLESLRRVGTDFLDAHIAE